MRTLRRHKKIMENKNWIYAENLADSGCVGFCKAIEIAKPVKSAEVTATALGIYNLYINGKKVGDALFKPGWTSYNYRLQYQRYDITNYLKSGENEICFLCAPGWAVGYLGKGNINHTYAEHISLTADIKITYNDDSALELVTNPTWDTVSDQVVSSEFYHGETQDLSVAPMIVGKAKADAVPDTRLILDEGADVTEHERLKPLKLIITPKGERVIDFGQNLAGYVEIRVKGNRKDRITISHAEVLDRDGNFYTKNLELARCTNTYILSGNDDLLKPKFTFQGYRYIRLDEYPFEEVDLSRFTSVAVYSDMERTGSFSCGNEKVNRLYSNSIWGQRSNFIDVPTDCPQRDERCGWTGDVLAFAKTAAIHYDVSAVLRKWLHDLILEQKSDGAIYGVVPSVNERGMRVSTAWGDVITVAPWEMYLAYGDAELLEECYPAMLKWISYIRHSGDEEYLWLGGNHYGDWLASDAILSPEHREGATQTDLIASAYFAHSVELAVRAGRVLKKDTKDLELLHQNIRKKFREYFIKDGLPTIYPKYDALSVNRPVKGLTQTSISLVLRFHLYEGEIEREKLTDKLLELIRENDGKMNTGFVGTPHILHALSENGRVRTAYDLFLSEKNPSWLFSVDRGATTIWEHWDSIKEDGSFWNDCKNSFNHYSYGCVFDWVYTWVLGIRPMEDAPAYQRFTLAPHPDERLGHAEGSIKTRYGTISVSWRYENGRINYSFTIPEGSSAEVVIPGDEKRMYSPGSYTIAGKCL